MNNLELYNKVRDVPKEALKEIGGGNLKGMSDINPMWRIKTLTEQFGPCGIGWYYEITSQWLEPGANGEVAGFCNINLYIKDGEQWSKPIPGTGGSSFVTKNKNGLQISDEVYKMALTDAISVACKALGVGANVYWAKDRTKYDLQTENAKGNEEPAKAESKAEPKPASKELTLEDAKKAFAACKDFDEVKKQWGKFKHLDANKEVTTIFREAKTRVGA